MQSTQPYALCTCPSPNNPGEAEYVVRRIKPTTTFKQFEELCKSIPNYTLNCGEKGNLTALHAASLVGNIELINHIVVTGGKSLLNLANNFGFTPLHCTVICENPNGYLSAIKLISLGAEINIKAAINEDITFMPTPLCTAFRNKKLEFAKLFLRQGAIPQRIGKDQEFFKCFEIANRELWTESEKLLMLSNKDQNSIISFFS